MGEWPLQDARNKFSALVEAALAGAPQRVTRRGAPAVVVLSVEEYDRLNRLEKASAPTLGQFLFQIPLDAQEFERLPLTSRPLGLQCSFRSPTCFPLPTVESGTRRQLLGPGANDRQTCT